ncbi:TLC domain-containing protein [Mycena floridula]|nr:TLC domain-containing protein [Mycena floridula]
MDVLVEAALGLGLSKLPPHIPTFIGSFAFFLSVHQIFAPVFSLWLFPETYGKMGRRAKNNWAIHIVSQVHAAIIVPLALTTLNLDSLDKDRAFGWDDRSGFVQAVACGYFLWDTLDAIIFFTDIGFVFHGFACLMIFMLSFKPFVAFYGARCLLWEASTFFLNIHWFLDKTGRTGGNLQLVNGIILLVVFFGVRIVYGGIISYGFLQTLYATRDQIPLGYVLVYGAGNIMLQGLNWLWYGKMIAAIRKRFSSKDKTL